MTSASVDSLMDARLLYIGAAAIVIGVALAYIAGDMGQGRSRSNIAVSLALLVCAVGGFVLGGYALVTFGYAGQTSPLRLLLSVVGITAAVLSAYGWGYIGPRVQRRMALRSSTIVTTAFAIVICISF